MEERRGQIGQFVHPIGMLGCFGLIALAMENWAIVFILFGVECTMLRGHHTKFHKGSFLSESWVDFVGISCVLAGTAFGAEFLSHGWGLSALALVCTTQLVSMGWHEHIHALNNAMAVRAAEKITGGLCFTGLATLVTILLGIVPRPFWLRMLG